MAACKRTRETCGPERLQKDLAETGARVGISRIRKIRKKLGIRCKQMEKFKATTRSKHTLPVAEKLLEQKFTASFLNNVWASDMPMFPPMKDGSTVPLIKTSLTDGSLAMRWENGLPKTLPSLHY